VTLASEEVCVLAQCVDLGAPNGGAVVAEDDVNCRNHLFVCVCVFE
jgi:hypothetical protein